MYKAFIFLLVSAFIFSCEDRDSQTNKIVFVDSIKLFEGFKMKMEYDKILENDLQKEAQLIDSLNILLKNTSDSNSVFRLRKDYYLVEQLYNSKFEQLSARYTKIVSERLNEYIKLFAEDNAFEMIVSGNGGNILYVKETQDYTDKMVEFANQKFEH